MKKTILFVDDEKDLVEMVRSHLEAYGYDVVTACTGKEALEKARAGHIDLMLLDIMMPGISGYDVLSELKNDPATSRIKVIMLTAKSETSSLLKAQSLGAADYVIKPFDFGELISLIKRYI